MKAVSFIEAIGNHIELASAHFLAGWGCFSVNEKQKGNELCAQGKSDVAKLTALKEFYLQEFSNNIIPKLFDDWTDNPKQRSEDLISSKNESIGNNSAYYFAVKKGRACYFIGLQEWETIMPSTLDDFIRDCQRMGIELMWRKEIVEKYFS